MLIAWRHLADGRESTLVHDITGKARILNRETAAVPARRSPVTPWMRHLEWPQRQEQNDPDQLWFPRLTFRLSEGSSVDRGQAPHYPSQPRRASVKWNATRWGKLQRSGGAECATCWWSAVLLSGAASERLSASIRPSSPASSGRSDDSVQGRFDRTFHRMRVVGTCSSAGASLAVHPGALRHETRRFLGERRRGAERARRPERPRHGRSPLGGGGPQPAGCGCVRPLRQDQELPLARVWGAFPRLPSPSRQTRRAGARDDGCARGAIAKAWPDDRPFHQ